jgi:hypothetical protein
MSPSKRNFRAVEYVWNLRLSDFLRKYYFEGDIFRSQMRAI